MPSGSYVQVFVDCPFYKYDDGKTKITCEGLTDNSSLAQIFRKKEDCEHQLKVFCCEDYTRCAIYRMLDEKYNK